MAWLPLHNEPERALAEEWLSWLDEGDLLQEDHFQSTLLIGRKPSGTNGPSLALYAARLARGALLAHAFSGLSAWRERGTRFMAFLWENLPPDTGSLSLADLTEIQQAFSLAWTGTGEAVWLEPMLKQTEDLKTRLESAFQKAAYTERAERVTAAARLARTFALQGNDAWLAWIGDLIHEEFTAMTRETNPESTATTAGDRPDLSGIAAFARMLRALVDANTCIPSFDIAESLPLQYRRFRETTALLDNPVCRKQAHRDIRSAIAWCETEVEAVVCHAALIERFPAAARLAWIGLRNLWWRWRDPDTWWLIPRTLRRHKTLQPEVLSPTLLLYAGLPDYLLGMRPCTQPLFE